MKLMKLIVFNDIKVIKSINYFKFKSKKNIDK